MEQKNKAKKDMRIYDESLTKEVSKTKVLKQQTRFNNGAVVIWNIHLFENQYYLLIDNMALYKVSIEQFNSFKDMT